MAPQHPSSDPIEGFVEQSLADIFGPSRPSNAGTTPGGGTRSGSDQRPVPWVPLSMVPAAVITAGVIRPYVDRPQHSEDSLVAPLIRAAFTALDWCADYLVLAICALVVTLIVDAMRWYARRHRAALTNQVYATTYIQPRSVYLPWPPGWRAPRRAVVKLPTGSVVAEKKHAALTEALTMSANNYLGSTWRPVIALHDKAGLTSWVMSADWQAGSGRLVITRARLVDASAGHGEQRRRLDAIVSERFPLPDARVTAVEVDDNDVECGFTISFSPTIHAARPALQQALREALTASLPPYPTPEGEARRMWTLTVYPEQERMTIGLAAAIPTYLPHTPRDDYAALATDDRYRVGFATGEAGVEAFWDVGPSTNRPHFLAVGPTGAGKTVMLRTLITGAVMRGVPVLAIDPKMIELNGMEGFPGVAAVAYSLRQIVELINAVHAEMMARSDYIARTHLPAETLTPFIVIMDEFFVMSGFIRRAMKYSGEDEYLLELKKFVADSAPLSKHAEIMALIRKVGGRFASGVQRPDAKNFGEDAGSVRDNYGMRASASNLSRDGAEMMWEDTTVGRDLDTSVRGRSTVIGPDGAPMTAQVWWTPNVDPHANAWAELPARDRDIVTALRDAAARADHNVTWHSAEMRKFLELMASTAPEPPTVIDGVDPATDGDDGVRAATLRAGDRIIGDNGRVLTVDTVAVTSSAVRATLTDPDRPRARLEAEWGPNEVLLTPTSAVQV
ncbi:MAG: hypothetical protein INR66_06730 [Gordonia polyisoprenivorans]|nr:hypothetical protein [Gordonia polyisoprenivorans]